MAIGTSFAKPKPAAPAPRPPLAVDPAEIERRLQAARAELQDAQARRAGAACAMRDFADDATAYASARAQRDRLADECERLELRVAGLEEQRRRVEQGAKLARLVRLAEANAKAVRQFELVQRRALARTTSSSV
jgi:hypothetical protein